ncbi:MAG: hypothetical protein ACE1Z4_03495 [Gammaproteobacteria bacterium]
MEECLKESEPHEHLTKADISWHARCFRAHLYEPHVGVTIRHIFCESNMHKENIDMNSPFTDEERELLICALRCEEDKRTAVAWATETLIRHAVLELALSGQVVIVAMEGDGGPRFVPAEFVGSWTVASR